jgi:hypothetical protein
MPRYLHIVNVLYFNLLILRYTPSATPDEGGLMTMKKGPTRRRARPARSAQSARNRSPAQRSSDRPSLCWTDGLARVHTGLETLRFCTTGSPCPSG